MAKTFLCRCEDITVDDCHEAITDGYTAFEDLKRFLGVGTGPCQGKACVQAAMHLIADARGIDPSDVDVMTFRPPVRPVSFATLAAVQEDDDGAPRGANEGDAPARAKQEASTHAAREDSATGVPAPSTHGHEGEDE